MIGAVLGDIAGSRFEFRGFKSKEFELLSPECSFTDDTVMTLAICKALLNYDGNVHKLEKDAVICMRELGLSHPLVGYGYKFRSWLKSENPQPYGSFGNGAAMRVSGCGYVAKSLEEVKALARAVTAVTHNHEEAIKAAEATAACVFLCNTGHSIEQVRRYIVENFYRIDFTLEDIRPDYRFEVSCQKSVPQALESFFESKSLEDAIRNAISLGGDSDTLAAISGSIAEPYYGVSRDLRDKAIGFLDSELKEILIKFELQYPPKIAR